MRFVAPAAAPLLALLTGGVLAAQQPPETRLSPSRALDTEPFSRIRGVQELSQGRVLVADQLEEALYAVDFGAQTRVLLGSRGEGPREYQAPTGLYPFPGDSALMVDISNGRLAVVDGSGVIQRTEPLFRPGVSIPNGVDEEGRLYWDDVSALRVAAREDPRLTQAAVLRLSPDGETIDTLAFLTIPPGGLGRFPDWDEWGAGADGWVAVLRNQEEYRLDWAAPDGRIIRGTPVAGYEPLRVSRADRAALEEDPRAGGGGGGSFSAGGSQPRRPPPQREVPSHFPPGKLGGVLVTYDGRALVTRHEHLDVTEPLLDVFDRAGRLVARFRLPEGRRVVGVGPSGLYAVRVDELDLQWLELYPLPS